MNQTKTSFIILIVLVFWGVIMAANLLAVLSFEIIGNWVHLEKQIGIMLQIKKGMEDWFFPITFLVPNIIIVVYLWPLLELLYSKKKFLSSLVKRRLLNAPLMLALLGITGWLTAIALHMFGIWKNQVPVNWELIFYGVLNDILTGSLCFVIAYYILELINKKKYFIPKFFPEGKLETCEGAINLSIRLRFYIYFFAVGVFPIFLLCKILVNITDQFAPDYSLLPIFLIVGAIYLLGAFLTYLISNSYQTPLVEMKEATGSIRAGSYEVNVAVVSRDELGSLGEGINEMTQGLKEKELIKDTFGKMVDPRVRDHLLKGNIALGGELREATIVFTDIRGFTSLSEKMHPDQVVRLLNRYFEKMSTCITLEHGFVNKYIGDAILAVFGLPLQHVNHAAEAVNAALRMRTVGDALNEELEQEGLPKILTGIGIHSGEVLAGNIGSTTRMEYTVIGDTVNIASRLESLCKTYKCDLILSEATVSLLETSLQPEYLETVQVRGREQAIRIFSL